MNETEPLFALNSFQFHVQGGLDFLGRAFAAGDAADIGTIDAEFAGYPAIKTTIQLVSLELRLFVIIRRHQW